MTTIYPWQQLQWDLLTKNLQQRRLPHALLLNGAAGMGKLTFAKALASLLLCSKATTTACGACQHCQLLQADTHPDFYLIQPEESKNIKIEQIRFLTEKLNQTAQLAANQVAIIYPAEAMNHAAANALLKTLEEPAGNVFLILVSHQPSLLSATIRSRCQFINFTLPNKLIIETWLQQQISQTLPQIQTLLALAEYVPLKALQLAQADKNKTINLIQDFYHLLADKQSALKLASSYAKENPKDILRELFTILHDVMKLQHLSQREFLLHQEQMDLLQVLAKKIQPNTLMQMQDELLAAQQLLSKNINLNAQLLFESLFIGFTNHRVNVYVS